MLVGMLITAVFLSGRLSMPGKPRLRLLDSVIATLGAEVVQLGILYSVGVQVRRLESTAGLKRRCAAGVRG